MKYLLSLVVLLALFGCAKEPADAPIPANGVLLWLAADTASAKDGKVQSWENAQVPNVNARPVHPERAPALVPGAINGRPVIRFDGTDQMMVANVDIGPARMPEGTIISVFRSATAERSLFRKLYGNDNGGFDRAIGLDDRADKNYALFTGAGVVGYVQLEANKTYITVDEYSPKEFSGWVNGSAALTRTEASWHEDALPNLYIGGTGTVFNEFWNGDIAEMIIYARRLSDAERTQVEDSLAQKYGVPLNRR